MKKLYPVLLIFCLFFSLLPKHSLAQPCNLLTAVATSYESRCAATGSIKINASGGSGNYKYKAFGPIITNYTSTDSITGLSAGIYNVVVVDITTNCIFWINNLVVLGNYQDPRFTLNKLDVTCDNASNGSIIVSDTLFGLAPFVYTIVAPSTMGIGTSNSTGIFQNLSAGQYSIRLTDSCGGIQTRQITINNYSWSLINYPFTKTSCYEFTGHIRVADSRGNISTVSGIPGFMYGIVRAPGDTIWSSSPYFTFTMLTGNNFDVVAKDSCGFIKTGSTQVSLNPQVGASVQISNRTCSTFSASLTNISNFFGAQFCLYNSGNTLIECNTSGSFNNIPYGNYCITAYDSCTDTTITRCFSSAPPTISIGSSVLISNKTCTEFTASITGQIGLTNPEYCLYDSNNVLIVCNSTGVFPNLSYGNYCITTKDGCRDTTITRCFTARKPTPYIPTISPSYLTCTNFGIEVGGDTLSSPQYCLYDSLGVLIGCNNTGIFDSLALGDYCVNVYDSCYDTSIVRCFTVGPPIIYNDIVTNISQRTCTTFMATISGANLIHPVYCLYDAVDSLILCNTTGIFPNLPYGDYCVKARNSCPDTLLVQCFTVQRPTASVDANVNISNVACSTFRATITGQYYLFSPQYCIYDTADNLISCNTTGVFNNLPYGTYCIKISNTCDSTIIVRCFTRQPAPIDIWATANKSCSFNYSRFTISSSNATLPIFIRILKPDGSLLVLGSYNTTTINIDSIPGVPAGQFYKIIAEDACGKKDSANSGALASNFNYNTTVIPKCPGAGWANGSGDIAMSITTNLGSVTVRIIKKNGVTYGSPLVPNSASGGVYTFTDLGPGTYILRSSESTCNRYVYDTVVISPYQFPNLNRSSAYQCDVNGFSVSAIATYGVAPFTYEIIGSVPSFPSIITSPQASSIFNINNGTTYSLIRLRAQDACGNATLGDASILPLANNGITVTDNCLFYPTTLSVDPMNGASYSWYKKETINATDSVYIGDQTNVSITSVLPSDTGIYICYLDVNLGCIKRKYIYHLDGSCYIVLPVTLKEFKGKQEGEKNVLSWITTNEEKLATYIVERQTSNNSFTEIGRVVANGGAGPYQYKLLDLKPESGNNFYRLKIMDKANSFSYSNIVLLNAKKAGIDFTIYPNPVKEQLNIRINAGGTKQYTIGLYNLANQLISQQNYTVTGNEIIKIIRPASISNGMYMIKIINTETKEQTNQKIIFL